mmetsp:Transcript_86939/g.243659  ORF Transcript_86939/g.243659 Transcript_86939/m.243659 type:complete len:472 (-) Transcript_86939:120-1535(-)
MPGAFQNGLGPDMWGITWSQLAALRSETCEFYSRRGDDPKRKSMRDVVADLIKPKTRGTCVGYALLLNAARPVRATHMISHSWDECFVEFVDAISIVSDAVAEEGLWICALAILQKNIDSDSQGAGPTIGEQLGDDILDGPFAIVVRQAKRMLVVQTREAPVYDRLWCVLELYQAIQTNVEVRLLGMWTWAASRNISPRDALCYDQGDADKIRSAIESSCGWATIERVILKRVKRILATRDEWPLVRAWEWKILEAIRLDDGALVHDVAADPDVNWDVRVGVDYGDPNDHRHIYYLVMSFGGLQWCVGHTILETARYNGCLKAAAAIEAYAGIDSESAGDHGEILSAANHATRAEGPCARSWEWKLLEAIRTSNVALVHEAASDPDVNWDVRIGELYGNLGDELHVYYLAMSFKLKWTVGHSLLETAQLNGRSEVARIIEAYSRAEPTQEIAPFAGSQGSGAASSKCCAIN